MTAERIEKAIRSYRYRWSDERELQEGIARALREKGVPFEREASIGPRERIDFLAGAVGVEVKAEARRTPVLRQLWRYARSERIDALVLVVPVRISLPEAILGKPVLQVDLVESVL